MIDESELVFGCRVSSGKSLRRCVTHKDFPAQFGTANFKRRWKYWKEKDAYISNGIFLGLRSLSNGTSEPDEYGYQFSAHESFKAALVCPGHNLNPVYVPLDAIELVPEGGE